MKKAVLAVVGIVAGAGTYYYFATGSKEYILPWRYPTDINASNYWWDLQETTDLTNWITIQWGVGPADPVVHIGTNQFRVYRLKGRL